MLGSSGGEELPVKIHGLSALIYSAVRSCHQSSTSGLTLYLNVLMLLLTVSVYHHSMSTSLIRTGKVS